MRRTVGLALFRVVWRLLPLALSFGLMFAIVYDWFGVQSRLIPALVHWVFRDALSS